MRIEKQVEDTSETNLVAVGREHIVAPGNVIPIWLVTLMHGKPHADGMPIDHERKVYI